MKSITKATLSLATGFFVGAGMFVSLPLVAQAQESNALKDDKPIEYAITGLTARGYGHVVMEALNSIVRSAYPGSRADFRPGSPAGGLQEIAKGRADFTGGTGAVELEYALKGKPPFREPLKGKIFQVMMLHNELTPYYLMTKEWSDEHGIRSMGDIAEKKPPMRVTVNTPANLQSTVAMYDHIFEEYGFTMDDVKKWGGEILVGNSGISMAALSDGRADVFINGRFMPDSKIAEIASHRPLRWIEIDCDRMEAAAEKWSYDLYKVPEGTHDFIEKPVCTQKMWNSIQAGAHVSDETVYKFLNAIYQNQDRVRAIHSSLKDFGPKVMVSNPTNLSWHPGAERFYREKGLLK